MYRKHIRITSTDVWLDIGAHIGAFCVGIGDQVKHIYAFEPDPTNYALLKRNVIHNNLQRTVTTSPFLVTGSWSEQRAFYLNTQKNKGSHSMYVQKGREAMWKKATHIQAVLDGAPINKIKLDAEGAETEIIPAVKDWSKIQEFVFEYHFQALKDYDHRNYFYIIDLLRERFPLIRYNPTPKKNWHTVVYCGR